jgi:hypothetical protein
MRQYLIEGATGAFPFIVDRSKPLVSESQPSGGSLTKIPGRFSVCDCVNGNNRRYRRPVWEKNLQTGSILQESIRRNAAFGLLEHPKDGVISLLSPISHHVTSAKMVESRDAAGKPVTEVVGEITLLDTLEGNKLKALIEGGYNPLVSSRGYGSLERASDGVDEVQEDYVCESWDVVIKPSFEQAELTPNRSTTNAVMAPKPTAESEDAAKCPECGALDLGTNKCSCGHVRKESKPNVKKHDDSGETTVTEAAKNNLKESKPSTGAASPPAAASATPNKVNSMELNEIKSRIATLESLDPSKLPPTRFAESLTQIEELHQEVATFSAADPKRSWDGTKLHKQLESVAGKFSESAQAPVKQAKKLAENNVKLMKVINAVAQTALTYKSKLGESMKTKTESMKLKEELTRRGQGWKRVAEDRQTKYNGLHKDWTDSCEALELMAKRYHEDTTDLARRCMVLEFKEKTATPVIQKMLKEATRLRHIAVIREMLEGKRPMPAMNEEGEGKKAAGVGKPTDGENPTMAKKKGEKGEKGECVASEPGKVTNESKDQQASATPVAKESTGVANANVTSEAKLMYSERDIRSLSESVDLVNRLRTATAK